MMKLKELIFKGEKLEKTTFFTVFLQKGPLKASYYLHEIISLDDP